MFMMSLPVLCMAFAAAAGAGELQDAARGHAVSIEALAGTVAANGLPIAVSRVVGPEVAPMAERLIARWREDSGNESVRVLECCGWRIASRVNKGRSEVIQWRTTTAGHELYLSTVNLKEPVRAAPSPVAPLPSGCTWTTPVHGEISGRGFVQVSAKCEPDAASVLQASIRLLAAEGWRWRRVGTASVQAERGLAQVNLVAAPVSTSPREVRSAKSFLVVVETRPADGMLP